MCVKAIVSYNNHQALRLIFGTKKMLRFFYCFANICLYISGTCKSLAHWLLAI